MTFSFADWRSAIELDLATNILPFWRTHTPDLVNGGFVGALTNDLKVRNDVPRSAVVCARILWTYAAAPHSVDIRGRLPSAPRPR